VGLPAPIRPDDIHDLARIQPGSRACGLCARRAAPPGETTGRTAVWARPATRD
jgi:hypothetical protein